MPINVELSNANLLDSNRTQKVKFDIRAEFFNIFNRLNLPAPGGNPAATPTRNSAGELSGGFGFINVNNVGGQRNGCG